MKLNKRFALGLPPFFAWTVGVGYISIFLLSRVSIFFAFGIRLHSVLVFTLWLIMHSFGNQNCGDGITSIIILFWSIQPRFLHFWSSTFIYVDSLVLDLLRSYFFLKCSSSLHLAFGLIPA